jgi:hypothetical protein
VHASPTADDDRPLPAARAFVVQLRAEAKVGRGHWVGRVVHVVSGQSSRFETLPELVAFIEGRLEAPRGQEPLASPNEA